MSNMLSESDEDDPTGEYPDVSPRRPWVNVEFGAHTDAGKVRERNEDQFLVAKLAKSMRICEVEPARAARPRGSRTRKAT